MAPDGRCPGTALLVAAVLAAPRAAALGPPLGSTVGNMPPETIELPNVNWPGTSAAESNAAFPGGQQPPSLRYWPQLRYGMLNRTLLNCHHYAILHTHAKGWPGLCTGLQRNPDATIEEACRTFCNGEPRCSMWQFDNQTVPGQCWVGYGSNCGTRGNEQLAISVQGAERVQHGSVRVLKTLSGIKVNNLWNMGFYATGDEQLSQERCRDWCYSNIGCEYWQYSSTADGCWVHAPLYSTSQGASPDNIPQYPLTKNGGATVDANFLIGEYVAHYCPPVEQPAAPLASAPTLQVPVESSFNWTIIVWALVGIAAVGGIIFYWASQQSLSSKKDVKGARELQPGASSGSAKRGKKAETEYSDEGSPLVQSQYTTPQPTARQPALGGAFPGVRSDQQSFAANEKGMGQTNSYGPSPPATQQAMVPPPPHFSQQSRQGQPSSSYQPPSSSYQPLSGYQPTSGYQPSYAGSARQGLPPPTQIVDFGGVGSTSQAGYSRAAMAPTQLLNQGQPFPYR